MEALTREAILGAARQAIEIEVPELDGAVYTMPMSAAQAEAFGDDVTVAEMVCKYILNDAGERMFTDEDLPMLRELSFGMMNGMAKGILKANGMGTEAVEELEKN